MQKKRSKRYFSFKASPNTPETLGVFRHINSFDFGTPLPEFESKVLDETMKRLMKTEPSKPYRK